MGGGPVEAGYMGSGRGGERGGRGRGVSAFHGPWSGKAARATQPWRAKRGAAGPGRGQGCRPALRPHSWPRASRGPGALSAPPPSRRFLARVAPAQPWTRGRTRAGRGALLLARRARGPRPAWGRGSRGGERRSRLRVPTPSFPPDAAPSPTPGLTPPPPPALGPSARGALGIQGTGEAPRTIGVPSPGSVECPHWLWSARNRDEGPGLNAWGWVELFGFGWLQRGSSAEEVEPPTPLTDLRSRTYSSPAGHCGTLLARPSAPARVLLGGGCVS